MGSQIANLIKRHMAYKMKYSDGPAADPWHA